MPEPDLPFDLRLRRQFLGDEAAPGEFDAPLAEDLPTIREQERLPEATGREMLALGAWQTLKPPWRGHQNAARKLRDRSDEVKHATDVLRTQLLQTLKARNWTRVAISAPTSGCGATFTALNLALSMSAIPDVRTVLLDLNQRAPGLDKALDITPVMNAADMLQRRVSYMDYLLRYGDNLAVGLSADTPHNPAEILQSREAAAVLGEMADDLTPDVMLFDMPAMLEYDDLTAFLPQVDAVLLVADGAKTLGRQMRKCERLLDGRAPLLGVVLNRGRVSAKKMAL